MMLQQDSPKCDSSYDVMDCITEECGYVAVISLAGGVAVLAVTSSGGGDD